VDRHHRRFRSVVDSIAATSSSAMDLGMDSLADKGLVSHFRRWSAGQIASKMLLATDSELMSSIVTAQGVTSPHRCWPVGSKCAPPIPPIALAISVASGPAGCTTLPRISVPGSARTT
jgi:hypothetical protein